MNSILALSLADRYFAAGCTAGLCSAQLKAAARAIPGTEIGRVLDKLADNLADLQDYIQLYAEVARS